MTNSNAEQSHGLASLMTERQFQDAVIELAKLRGWRVYHVPDSRRCEAGWPDLTLWRPPRFVLAELKTDKGRLSPIQEQTLAELRDCELEVYLWRPNIWTLIEKVLQ